TGSGYIPPPQCTKREDAKVVGWFCRYIPKDRHKSSEWVYVILDKPPLKESPATKRAKQTNPKKRR
ncbi:MAG: hypothetical protein KGO83_07120, partial [Paenibacillaceae bacterium]|nr:hypothetical protein [Paenibacillaceae bacterium]